MTIRVLTGDALEKLDLIEDKSIDCCFTSPDPPFHNKVGVGASTTIEQYHYNLMAIFKKVYRVLKDSGTLWLQMGSFHDGGRLTTTPFTFPLMMSMEGWILRSDLIWHRPDEYHQEDMTRFRRDAEHVFFFTKTMNYYFNPKYCNTSVFSFKYNEPKPDEFTSGFPEGLIEVCLQSGCPEGGTVLDPFCDSGSTGVVALRNKMSFVGIELQEYKIPKILKKLKKTRQY